MRGLVNKTERSASMWDARLLVLKTIPTRKQACRVMRPLTITCAISKIDLKNDNATHAFLDTRITASASSKACARVDKHVPSCNTTLAPEYAKLEGSQHGKAASGFMVQEALAYQQVTWTDWDLVFTKCDVTCKNGIPRGVSSEQRQARQLGQNAVPPNLRERSFPVGC